MIKSWSTTQTLVALSSGEAELYALVKASAEGLDLGGLVLQPGVGFLVGGIVLCDAVVLSSKLVLEAVVDLLNGGSEGGTQLFTRLMLLLIRDLVDFLLLFKCNLELGLEGDEGIRVLLASNKIAMVTRRAAAATARLGIGIGHGEPKNSFGTSGAKRGAPR